MYNVPITHAASLTYLDSLCLPEGPDPGEDLRGKRFPTVPHGPLSSKVTGNNASARKSIEAYLLQPYQIKWVLGSRRASAAYTGSQVQGRG